MPIYGGEVQGPKQWKLLIDQQPPRAIWIARMMAPSVEHWKGSASLLWKYRELYTCTAN